MDASGSTGSAPPVTAAACALAMGTLMGTRALIKAVPKSDARAPELATQEAAFCRYIATSLATHTAMSVGHGAADEAEDAKAGGNGAGGDVPLTPEQAHAEEHADDEAAHAREEAIHRTLRALAAYMMVDEHRAAYIQIIGDWSRLPAWSARRRPRRRRRRRRQQQLHELGDGQPEQRADCVRGAPVSVAHLLCGRRRYG
eukprot:TRINITY_DN2207_c0_g1_i6.p1 TRINITY_DN2207_c0_g1~~TRINITY_DN2207_c0_g1_i6.p1  ORF type:complete len:200 (-),score=61.04 TRINITY_DN2207_c0_g1_i6:169-768(-)